LPAQARRKREEKGLECEEREKRGQSEERSCCKILRVPPKNKNPTYQQ
jgi:hypothetical protein